MAAATEVYRALYSSDGASYEEVRRLLPVLEAASGVTLLGDHEHSTGGSASAGDTAFADAVGDLVKHWRAPPDPLRGQSLEGLLRDSRLVVPPANGNRGRLRHLIRRLGDRGTSRTAVRRPQAVPLTVDAPVPSSAATPS